MTAPDPRAIAERLSASQRRAMLWLREAWRRAGKGAPRDVTLASLEMHELCVSRMYGVDWEYRLTTLGLAVRAALEQMETTDGE